MVEIVKYSNQILKSTLITLSVWVFKAKIKKRKKKEITFPCSLVYLFIYLWDSYVPFMSVETPN